MAPFKNEQSFTLIELVIVIGILAVLAVVVIIVLNPAEFLRQARDSTRLSDLQTLNSAIGHYQADGGTSLGTANTVYVSIPSSQGDCSDLGLPSLPADWFYACSSSDNYRKVDNNGWIPINLTSVSFGSPLDALPIDPVNTTSTGNYYTYVTGGSWKLATLLESQKYTEKAAKDGGVDLAEYEIGTNLALAPFTHGLVGYWKFDETSGTLYDSSGYGNNGTQSGGVTYGATGKVGNALSFDGVDDYVTMGNIYDYNLSQATWSAWIKASTISSYSSIFTKVGWGAGDRWGLVYPAASWGSYITDGSTQVWGSANSVGIGTWLYLAATYDGSNLRTYLNGTLITTQAASFSFIPGSSSPVNIGAGNNNPASNLFNGLIDEVRIYNRALSAAEIAAIYNATK